MLLGTFRGVELTQDGLVLPADLRGGLEQGYVITRGLDGCLAVFPPEEWDCVVQRIETAVTFLRAAARLFQRHFYGGAATGSLEAGGLMRIPEHLRRYAELDDEGVLVGVGNRVEIWNPQRWSYEEFTMNERSLQSSAELSELGV
ncbi:MAG TPA: cell division/cell wall cluster transcriptional repressor MraZ [Anaerolineae bacterium]|jgi:MraZ protein|nr:cell division/cell wall cluster transcriptional repressor MraZ [Anaerolineae bacterium]